MHINKQNLVDELIAEDNTTTISDYTSIVKDIEDVLRSNICSKCMLEITKDCEICNGHATVDTLL